MVKAILFVTLIAVTLSLFACTSCPVPPSAPRTYSLYSAPGDADRN